MKTSFKVDINSKLKKSLQNLNDDIMRYVKKLIIESAMVDIESQAKQRLTDKRHVQTGRLRASIHTRYADYNTKYGYRNLLGESFTDSLKVQPIDKKTFFECYVGTSVNYAGKIERLDPYLYPSFKQAQKDLQKEIKNYLKKL